MSLLCSVVRCFRNCPPPFLPARPNSCSYSFSGYFPIGLLGRLFVLAELGSATVFFGLPFSGDERTKGSNGPRIPSAVTAIPSPSEFVGAFTSVDKIYISSILDPRLERASGVRIWSSLSSGAITPPPPLINNAVLININVPHAIYSSV